MRVICCRHHTGSTLRHITVILFTCGLSTHRGYSSFLRSPCKNIIPARAVPRASRSTGEGRCCAPVDDPSTAVICAESPTPVCVTAHTSSGGHPTGAVRPVVQQRFSAAPSCAEKISSAALPVFAGVRHRTCPVRSLIVRDGTCLSILFHLPGSFPFPATAPGNRSLTALHAVPLRSFTDTRCSFPHRKPPAMRHHTALLPGTAQTARTAGGARARAYWKVHRKNAQYFT
jgi:hypothetical protein